MNLKQLVLITYLGALATTMSGQGLESFLREVASSHPVIQHYGKIVEARRVESFTGNTPGDLTLGFGYFPGTPDAIGIKRTLEATQSFEFPTIYLLRKNINRETFSLAETEFLAGKTELLLEARLLAIRYLGTQRQLDILREKLNDYDVLLKGWDTMLAEGAITILDYNRLKMEISIAHSEIAELEASLKAMKPELDYCSGGRAGLLDGSGYDEPELPELDRLLELRRSYHPAFILKEREYNLALRQVDLSRAENLPGLNVGVGSEIIAGEHHTGPKIGISFPLWTNRNQVKLSKANAEAAGAGREASVALLINKTEAEYDYYSHLKLSYDRLKSGAAGAMETALLAKALREKEITITDYFAYIESVYESRLALVKLENECMASLSRLLDHILADY
ncbi:MAG: TolC family protein [Bacteroidales bacterium]|jgi:outer membrane protein TolC|nr:TolC family protein [Bacteroidales bacterium]